MRNYGKEVNHFIQLRDIQEALKCALSDEYIMFTVYDDLSGVFFNRKDEHLFAYSGINVRHYVHPYESACAWFFEDEDEDEDEE